MSKSGKIFRWVWRIDAILILVAAGAITFGVGALLVAEFGARSARRQEAAAGPVVAAGESDRGLILGRATLVTGTPIMRAELMVQNGGAGFSSGGYSETRNLLFIAPGEKSARWLLPDHDHVITENHDIVKGEEDPKTRVTLATAALVKDRGAAPETAVGRLLLFDVAGRHIVGVADGVRALHTATLSGADLALLYERDRRLFLATFDPESLEKRSEQQMDIPSLK